MLLKWEQVQLQSPATALSGGAQGPLIAGTQNGELFEISRGRAHLLGAPSTRAIQSIAMTENPDLFEVADEAGEVIVWSRSRAQAEARFATGLSEIRSLQALPEGRRLITGLDRAAWVVSAWDARGKRMWQRPGQTHGKAQWLDSHFWLPMAARLVVLSESGAEVGTISGPDGQHIVMSTPDGRFYSSSSAFPSLLAVSDDQGNPLPFARVQERFDEQLDMFESRLARMWRLTKASILAPGWAAFSAQPLPSQVLEAVGLTWLLMLAGAPAALARKRMAKEDGSPSALDVLARIKPLEIPWLELPIDWACSNRRCRTAYLRQARPRICEREEIVTAIGPYADLGHESELNAALEKLRRKERVHLWFSAPGGRGKTTLAKRLAHELATGTHAIVPVFLDHDWLLSTGEEPRSFLESVSRRLAFLGCLPPPAMVRQWLQEGSVVLFIDGVSEKSVRHHPGFFQELEAGIRPRALVITARSRPPQGTSFQVLEPRTLTRENAGEFCQVYLGVDHPLLANAEAALAGLIQRFAVTPMFARHFLARVKDTGAIPQAPTPAAMIREYVASLCGGAGLRADHFLWAAQVVAKTTLDWETFTPVTVRRERVAGAIDGAANATYFRRNNGEEQAASAVLDELIDSGLLLAAGTDQIRFREEPVAEYLAAAWMDLQETRYRDDWLKKLARKDSRRGEFVKQLLRDLRQTANG